VDGRGRESQDRKAVSAADPAKITGISSMATREVLAELGARFERRSGRAVAFESVGGVDAAKRVAAGEPFDVVVLASDAIDKLIDAGRILAGSKIALARSGVAIAVRSGAPRPEIGSEEAVRRAVLSARSVGYSTGPSGVDYTTAPKALEDWRNRQIAGIKDPAAMPKVGDLRISDDELRESIESNQLKLMRQRGSDLTIFSPRATPSATSRRRAT
jgi:ABC-type molybdate transport system substrate-binding protein